MFDKMVMGKFYKKAKGPKDIPWHRDEPDRFLIDALKKIVKDCHEEEYSKLQDKIKALTPVDEKETVSEIKNFHGLIREKLKTKVSDYIK